MKQNPQKKDIREDLTAGRLTRDGFLGADPRPFEQIILEDAETLRVLNVTPEQIAEKMQALTQKGLEGMGQEVQAGEYQVTVEEFMGRIVCPFHDRRAAKRNTAARDNRGREMSWTDLSIHLISTHGFFQGKGSAFRLEPAETADFLGLTPHQY